MKRISLALTFICVFSSVSAPEPVSGSFITPLNKCLVQELRSPMPKPVIEYSLPEGFAPANFEGLPDSPVGTTATTSFLCMRKGREIAETWVWVPVIPPGNLQSQTADEYGFFIKAFNGSGLCQQQNANAYPISSIGPRSP